MSLALYRRYRPDTFEQVIGQEHVTEPLQRALSSDRVSHAYLFSGPRGCGKTTSARILARCLNCEQGPTATPCGTCQSCQDLARGGPGSLDVIEIDAASHGGVDDARELRERAFFAPASARYKIYIVDEAHMVSPQGFNALLKLVEEPPEHVKFIFATTEPEKVIGTIRSRTHHYPFRLVPPGVLQEYLATLCAEEGVAVEPNVLPLVVRAGGGSVRDSLSILDQLVAGAGPDGVAYPYAAGLLGYTDIALLGDVVDAIAAHDGASAFAAVDRVIEGGLEPRRFVADLLERFRDLVVLAAVPGAAEQGLVTGPVDEVAAMSAQASRFGQAQLVRSAELLATGLTEMRGATAPRLQLELLVARLLLPGADDGELGLAARVDTLERRLAIGGVAADTGAPPVTSSASVKKSAPTPAPAPEKPAARAPKEPKPVAAAEQSIPEAPPEAAPAPPAPAPTSAPSVPAPEAPAAAMAPAGGGGSVDVAEVRRMWPAVLDDVKARKRVSWMLLFEKTTVLSVSDDVLSLAFDHAGSAKGFTAGGHDQVLQDSLAAVLGVTWRVAPVVDPGRAGAAAAAVAATPAPAAAPAAAPATPPAAASSASTSSATDASPPAAPAEPTRDAAPSAPPAAPRVAPEHDVVSDDDSEAPDAGLTAEELIAQQLGGTKIGEIDPA
jgi:DNA polymerase-3 subunit gamma/tau